MIIKKSEAFRFEASGVVENRELTLFGCIKKEQCFSNSTLWDFYEEKKEELKARAVRGL